MYEDRILRLLEQNPTTLYTEEDIQVTLIGKNPYLYRQHTPFVVQNERDKLSKALENLVQQGKIYKNETEDKVLYGVQQWFS